MEKCGWMIGVEKWEKGRRSGGEAKIFVGSGIPSAEKEPAALVN